jgi:hypothetical protein
MCITSKINRPTRKKLGIQKFQYSFCIIIIFFNVKIYSCYYSNPISINVIKHHNYVEMKRLQAHDEIWQHCKFLIC